MNFYDSLGYGSALETSRLIHESWPAPLDAQTSRFSQLAQSQNVAFATMDVMKWADILYLGCERLLLFPALDLFNVRRATWPYEYDAVRSCLSPHARTSLFTLALYLDEFSEVRFYPPQTNANSSQFFDATQNQNHSTGFSGFEYFCACFASHAKVHMHGRPQFGCMDVPTDCVYFTLLQEYARELLPADGRFSWLTNTLDSIAAQTSHNEQNAATNHQHFSQNRSGIQMNECSLNSGRNLSCGYYGGGNGAASPLGLLKLDALEKLASGGTQSSFLHTSPAQYKQMSFISTTHNQSQFLDTSQKMPNELSTRVLATSWTFARILLETWCDVQGDVALPPADRLMAIRYLVKMILAFCGHDTQQSMAQLGNNPNLKSVCSSMVDSIVKGPLWVVLSRCFEGWPLDASFRHPLELYLAYIQPNRYTSKWATPQNLTAFVSENEQFYTRLLQMAVDRLCRTHLDTIEAVNLVIRLARVLGSEPLCGAVRTVVTKGSQQSFYSTNFVEGNLNQPGSINSIAAAPLYDALIDARAENLENIKTYEQDKCRDKSSQPSWLQSALSFLTSGESPTDQLGQLKKLDSAFKEAQVVCKQAFNSISDWPVDESGQPSQAFDAIRQRATNVTPDCVGAGVGTYGDVGSVPECEKDLRTGLLRLTSRGRQQLLSTNSRLNFCNSYESCVPLDTRPVGSVPGEISYFVQPLLSCSRWINGTRFGGWARCQYYGDPMKSYATRLCRRLMAPPALPVSGFLVVFSRVFFFLQCRLMQSF